MDLDHFAADPGIVGRNVLLDGQTYTVIGVMPPKFKFPDWAGLWVPLAWSNEKRAVRGNHNYMVIGRLKPEVAVQQAKADLSAISARLEQQYPEDDKGWGATVLSLREQIVGDVRPALLVLLGAVAFVLLIACANVANLVLAKTLARKKELAIRTSLGASRAAVLRQILAETLLLSLAGGTVGLFLARFGIALIQKFLADRLPSSTEITLDVQVLAFTLFLALFAGILAGLLPAVRFTRTDVNEALKQGQSRGSSDSGGSKTRGLLVVSEVALSLVLLIGAGLMIRSFGRLAAVKPGFNTDQMLTMRVQLASAKYSQDPAVIAFFQEAVDRISRLPGVRSAGAINYLPFTGLDSATGFSVVGRPKPAPGEEPTTGVRVVHPNYFRAMGIPLLRGREFSERDTKQSPRVLIISQSLARQFFADEDAIGKKLIIEWGEDIPDEIVGVVGDVLHDGLDTRPEPAIYWPEARMPYQFMALVVRTAGDPKSLASGVIKEIHSMDPDQPVSDVRGMNEVVAASMSRQRFNMLLLAIFAMVAPALAAVGIYGVMAYGVTQRTHEIGIRIALGAGRAEVMRMVVTRGMILSLGGIALGLGASFALTRLMKSLLFGITATDPATYAALSSVLVLIALAACSIPALRATRVDPMVALRYE